MEIVLSLVLFPFLLFPFFWFCFCAMFQANEPNEEVIVEYFSQPAKRVEQPGLFYVLPIFSSVRRVNKRIQTINLENIKIPDKNGSPLSISVVVTYKIEDAVKNSYNCTDPSGYIEASIFEVLKLVISAFPYDSQIEDEVSLKMDSLLIGRVLRHMCNIKNYSVGISVLDFQINELFYAHEIVQQMMQKQLAQAMIDSRKQYVEAAASITKNVMEEIEGFIQLNEDIKEELEKQLFLVICTDHNTLENTKNISQNRQTIVDMSQHQYDPNIVSLLRKLRHR